MIVGNMLIFGYKKQGAIDIFNFTSLRNTEKYKTLVPT